MYFNKKRKCRYLVNSEITQLNQPKKKKKPCGLNLKGFTFESF